MVRSFVEWRSDLRVAVRSKSGEYQRNTRLLSVLLQDKIHIELKDGT